MIRALMLSPHSPSGFTAQHTQQQTVAAAAAAFFPDDIVIVFHVLLSVIKSLTLSTIELVCLFAHSVCFASHQKHEIFRWRQKGRKELEIAEGK